MAGSGGVVFRKAAGDLTEDEGPFEVWWARATVATSASPTIPNRNGTVLPVLFMPITYTNRRYTFPLE